MTFTMATACLRTGSKVKLPEWTTGSHLLLECRGEGPGGGTHILIGAEIGRYSGYDDWTPTLEELSSRSWEIIEDE